MSTPANQQYGVHTSHPGSLPFTGADVGIPMTAGILALVIGLAFRRFANRTA